MLWVRADVGRTAVLILPTVEWIPARRSRRVSASAVSDMNPLVAYGRW